MGRYKKGESGNLGGRPTGSRNRSTLAILALMEGESEAITRVAIAAALAGDMQAIKLVLDRLIPAAKERPITLALPDTSTAEGVSHAQQAILQAVASGEIAPGVGSILTSITENHRRSIATIEHEIRISTLEQLNGATT